MQHSSHVSHASGASGEPIAVVGIGCRCPGGAVDSTRLWQLLASKVDAIGSVPSDRWDPDRYYSPRPQQPGRMSSLRAGFLDRVNAFDASFFGISPRVAESMDPQQRLLIEVCWEAFEDAGVVPESLARSRSGVFMGACGHEYGDVQSALSGVEVLNAHWATGTFMSIIANRLSYMFDLRGPSMTIDTACSSSLVAVHLACESLRAGDSTLIGHSLGGALSSLIAGILPERVHRLVLIDAIGPLPGTTDQERASVERYVRACLRTTPPRVYASHKQAVMARL
jgi:acyl transferase domain-containing protein